MLFDLHVHLRGTLTRRTVVRLAKRNGVTFPSEIKDGLLTGWHDFKSFLQRYDLVTSVVRTARDLEEVALEYLTSCASQGGVYVEFMMSPPDLLRVGISLDDQIAAIDAAATQAQEAFGIDCRLIATAVRHLGGKAAIAAARLAAARRSNTLVGFGLTGNETMFPVRDFEESFRIARGEGLHATAHAGEHRPAETIIEAIEVLGLSRVGHGIRAAECSSTMRQLANARMPLEICIGSNLSLGLYPSIETHPASDLANAGCSIVLGTDDPGFFRTTISQEYTAAKRAHTALDPISVTKNAIEAAFCEINVKERLRRKLQSS